MVFADGWTCPVCWKSNRPQDPACYRCKTPRELPKEAVEERRKELAAIAERPEIVPDLVVALPVVVFRGYARAWRRGGIGVFGVTGLMLFGGVTDVGWLLVTAILGAALIGGGILAGEVIDGMRAREAWAFIVGIVLSVVGVIGSIVAFEALAPGLLHPTAVRWGSIVVFGGAGAAAALGLALLVVRRDRSASG